MWYNKQLMVGLGGHTPSYRVPGGQIDIYIYIYLFRILLYMRDSVSLS